MLKKIKIVSGCLLLGGLFTMPNVQAAQERDIVQIYTQCGLGGVLLGGHVPILASVTNVVFDLGTTALLSNSFSPETCKQIPLKTAVFIKESFSALENDLAIGQGEHLEALNMMMGCAQASQNLRKEYAEYSASTAYDSAYEDIKAQQMFNIVDRYLSSSACTSS